MKKFAIILCVLAALYAIAAGVACLVLPKRMADVESRAFGIHIALMKITDDLALVESRLGVVKDRVRKKGLSKITETALILDDPDLNRLAMVYLREDWEGRERAFLEKVNGSRGRLFREKRRDEDRQREQERKTRDLELRKKMLSHRLHTPHCERDFEERRQKVEAQLAKLFEVDIGEVFSKKTGPRRDYAAAWAKNEKNLLELANREEADTVGTLLKHLTVEQELLRWMQEEPVRLRRVAAIFDVWPFKRFRDVPARSQNEE